MGLRTLYPLCRLFEDARETMKHRTPIVLAAMALLLLPNFGFAYEIGTHAKITEETYKRSVLRVSRSDKWLNWDCLT